MKNGHETACEADGNPNPESESVGGWGPGGRFATSVSGDAKLLGGAIRRNYPIRTSDRRLIVRELRNLATSSTAPDRTRLQAIRTLVDCDRLGMDSEVKAARLAAPTVHNHVHLHGLERADGLGGILSSAAVRLLPANTAGTEPTAFVPPSPVSQSSDTIDSEPER